jgi:hypothetical protein
MRFNLKRTLKPIAVPILESAYKAKDGLKLAMLALGGRSRIKGIANADSIAHSRKFVIFAAYPTLDVASAHIRLLAKFQKAGYSIIICSNHPRTVELFADAIANGWVVISRMPFGRDFGCYQDSIAWLLNEINEQGQIVERIVLLNDSILTFDSAEAEIIRHLDAGGDFSGLTENYNFGRHLGSFSIGLSQKVIYSKAFGKYWQTYKPYSTRRHAINAGEIGFSKKMIKAGFAPRVLWSLSRLKEVLHGHSFESLCSIVEAMEQHLRSAVGTPLAFIDRELAKSYKTDLLAMLPQVSKEKSSPSEEQLAAPLAIVNIRDYLLGLEDGEQKRIAVSAAKSALIDALLRHVFRGSQIHHGAALLLFVGAGILKKDVVYRRIVEPFSVRKLLSDAKVGSQKEIIEAEFELLQKDHPYSLRGWAKTLYDWDFA